jgi:Tol biopolymer transport system component
MNGRRGTWLLVSALTISLGSGILATAQKSQQADVLFESAKQKELVEGKLEEAIKLYQRIVQDYAANRPVAAKALLRMGHCYERLGQADARKAYERLVREFGDQTETVTEARARLAALAGPGTPGKTELTVRQVWAGRNADNTGSPSSDGRFLAATDWWTGNVAIRDLATGEMRSVTKTGDVMKSTVFGFHAKFSPDDKQIAYAWYDPKNGLFDLWLVGADGAGVRTLYREEKAGVIVPPCWTPDGKSIVAIVNMTKGDKSNQIVLVSAERGAVRVLKSSSQGDPTGISASPDGRFLVYDVPQADGKRDIFLFPLPDGPETRLVEHPADDGAPIWQPDGGRVLFMSDRTGSAALWAQKVAGGKAVGLPELVKPDIGRKFVPMGFTRNGALFYGNQTDMTDVYVAAFDLKAGRLLGAPAPISQQMVGTRNLASWSPDGRYLAYLSTRGPGVKPGNMITIRATDTERDVLVDASTIRRLVWAPDGTAMIFPGLDREWRPGVFRVDIESGVVSTLVHAGPNVVIPQAGVTRDGKSLVYLAMNVVSGLQPIVVRDLQTGQEKIITEPVPTPTGMALSPDGLQVAVTTADEASGKQALVVVPVAGGAAREIYKVDKPRSILRFPVWTPDGTQILCGVSLPDKTEALLVPVSGGDPQKLAYTMNGITDLSFHPDGKRVAFSAGRPQNELWVMENFLPPLKKSK